MRVPRRRRGHPDRVLTLTGPERGADVCPLCSAHLGRGRGATRRRIVFCPTPGVFRWRCPECDGVWQVRPRERASA